MELIKQNKTKNTLQLTFIDLFCGIGGIRQAFERNDCKCVFASEIDKYASSVYYENYLEVPFGDIGLINSNDIPKFDILTAGFPCQPFSVGGLRKGFDDNRGLAIFDIFRILNHHKPQAFLLENVKGLLVGKQKDNFNFIINTLQELGYFVSFDVLSAKNFGLAQNRERLYIVGFLEKNNFKFPSGCRTKTRISDFLDNSVDDKYTISNTLLAGLERRSSNNKSKNIGFRHKINSPSDEYTNTITARYFKDGRDCLIKQDNKNPRKLTPKEVARLQGFKEDFKMPVSDSRAYQLLGNSVAINVVEAIAKKMVEFLKK